MYGGSDLHQWSFLLATLETMPGSVAACIPYQASIAHYHPGMYRGYKARNKRLERLDREPHQYLTESRVALANLTFHDIDSEEVLVGLHDYLAAKLALLERVIRARKTHHSHFFSLNLDYGHQHYLDILSSQKFITLRALERLDRRTADVLYEKRKWFEWVRECQDTEEAHRENEKKKVKQEAALFRRHQKDIRLREKELKAKEDLKRQDAELDKAYQERLSQEAMDEDESDMWDPIEDIVEDQRTTYIELIKGFLFISQPAPGIELPRSGNPAKPEKPVTSAAEGSKDAKKKSSTAQTAIDASTKSGFETLESIQHRLREGVDLSYSSGMYVAGTIDNPVERINKTAPLPDDEIHKLSMDLADIKLLLFCRLLLSHATLLPKALEAASVEEFFLNKEVTDNDLRDLCLKMENPGLQEIRDACADLGRKDEGDEEVDEVGKSVDEDDDEQESKSRRMLDRLGFPKRKKGAIPEKWSSKQEKEMKKLKSEIPQEFMGWSSIILNNVPTHPLDF